MRYHKVICLLILAVLSAGLYPVAFKDGEKLTFKVKYGIVSAGEAVLEAKSSSYQGNPVWHLSTTAKTYSFFDPFFKVRDRVESWWDKQTLLPYKFSKTLQEGNYRQHRIHTFDQAGRSTYYQKWSYKTDTWTNETQALPFDTQDMLSAFYEVRNRNLKPGAAVTVNITSDGRSVPTEIAVHRRERASTIFGTVDCLVIEPRVKSEAIFKQSGNILIWVTDDDYKIPVKLQSAVTFGSFIAILTDARNVPYSIKNPAK
ncbi:MAG: DUF3108 domain-containing protein [Candidatus Syntrophosphaera sp.]|nr:DUF3108 domain-containing protein [Candidatus Syntrophosphaera sp.]